MSATTAPSVKDCKIKETSSAVKMPDDVSKGVVDHMAERLFLLADKILSTNEKLSSLLSLDSDILALVKYLRKTPRSKWTSHACQQILEYHRYVCTLEHPQAVASKLRQASKRCQVGNMVHWMGKQDGQLYYGQVVVKNDFNDIRVVVDHGGWYKISIHMSQLVEFGSHSDSKTPAEIANTTSGSAAEEPHSLQANSEL